MRCKRGIHGGIGARSLAYVVDRGILRSTRVRRRAAPAGGTARPGHGPAGVRRPCLGTRTRCRPTRARHARFGTPVSGRGIERRAAARSRVRCGARGAIASAGVRPAAGAARDQQPDRCGDVTRSPAGRTTIRAFLHDSPKPRHAPHRRAGVRRQDAPARPRAHDTREELGPATSRSEPPRWAASGGVQRRHPIVMRSVQSRVEFTTLPEKKKPPSIGMVSA